MLHRALKRSSILTAGLVSAAAAAGSYTANKSQCSASDSEFAGKTVIITGAGGEFGRHGTLYFIERGANVVATDGNNAKACVLCPKPNIHDPPQ